MPWWRVGLVLGGIALVAAAIHSRIDVAELQALAARLPAWLAFVLLTLLPMAGFPVSLLHVAAGVRFGAGIGLAVVAASIALQIALAWLLVRRWRKFFERVPWLGRLRRRIPAGARGGVCVFSVLLPGAPYSAITYVLPLLGVPLRTLLLYAWPVHCLRSTVTVVLGDQLDEFTVTRLVVLLAYASTILFASWLTYRRLQAGFENPPPAEGDPKRPA